MSEETIVRLIGAACAFLSGFALGATIFFWKGYTKGRIDEMRHGHDFEVINPEDLNDE